MSENKQLKDEKLRKQLQRFIKYSIIVFVSSVMVALFVVYFETLFPQQIVLNDFGAVGGFMQGTLGIAVSLAGSYVAIRIAGLGYEMLKKEDKRENYIAVDNIINLAIPPFFKVTQEFQKLIDIYDKIANDSINPLVKEELEESLKKDTPDYSIKPDNFQLIINKKKQGQRIDLNWFFFKELRDQLNNLRTALEEIRSNQYSYYMFIKLANKSEEKNTSLLSKYKEFLADKNSSERKSFTIANSFNDLIFYLKSFERLLDAKIKEPTFNDLYMPYISLFKSFSTTDLNINKIFKGNELTFHNISSAHRIMAMGLMICFRCWWNNEPDDSAVESPKNYEFEYFNLGGIILIDLVNILLQDYKTYEKTLSEVIGGIELENDVTARNPFLKMLASGSDNDSLWFNSSLSKGVREIIDKGYEFKFTLQTSGVSNYRTSAQAGLYYSNNTTNGNQLRVTWRG